MTTYCPLLNKFGMQRYGTYKRVNRIENKCRRNSCAPLKVLSKKNKIFLHETLSRIESFRPIGSKLSKI